MQWTSRAADATVFLSTATVMTGFFLAAVATAVVSNSNLPMRREDLEPDPANADQPLAKLVRKILFTLLIINTSGTLIPFILLFFDTVTRIRSFWVFVAFIDTLLAIFVNLGTASLIYLAPMIARRFAGLRS